MMEYDSVVIGAGVMGYSTALQLVKDGRKTLLLEQFLTPHTRGSSTGQSRVTRVANYGPVELNPMMVAANEAWMQLQAQADTQLFVPAPMLCIGRGEEMDQMRQSIIEAESTPKYLTAELVQELYGCKFSSDLEFFLDPKAGVLLADQCILALKKQFEENGGKIVDRWPVTRLERLEESDAVLVHGGTASQVVKASRVVVCAGAWTSTLMQSVGVHLPLTPLKIAVCYWRMRDPTLTFPVFVSTDEKSGNYYGLPSIEYPGLVKVCLHTGVPCDPDNRDLVNMDELNVSSCKYISKHFPCLEPRPAIVESCMYTVTPDKQMILDTVPGCTNIAYACGFSGTGFKLGPIVGRLMCQMVTGKPLDYNVKRFSAARFTTAS